MHATSLPAKSPLQRLRTALVSIRDIDHLDSTATLLATHAPSTSDLLERPNSNDTCATSELAESIRHVAQEARASDGEGAMLVDRAARRLTRCAHAGKLGTGWRCGNAACPRCACQRASQYQKRLALRMHECVDAGTASHGFALLTLTLAASDPVSGYHMLQRARSDFFRGVLVRAAIAGGESHIQIEPASGGEATTWNAHLHAIVELKQRFHEVDIAALQSTWAQVLNRLSARGSLDLRQDSNLTAASLRSRSHNRNFHPAAYYISRRTPGDWTSDSADVLLARFRFLAEQPRLVTIWGTWRKPRKRSVQPPGVWPNGSGPRNSANCAFLEISTEQPENSPMHVATANTKRHDVRMPTLSRLS